MVEKEGYIARKHQIARAVGERLLTSIPFAPLPSEVVHPERLKVADAYLRMGRGLVILGPHFSRKETMQIFQIPYRDPEMRKRRIVFPVARHQRKRAMDIFAPFFDVEPKSIVTRETQAWARTKGLPIPDRSEGTKEYLDDVFDALSHGGITILFPQTTRQSTLGTAKGHRALTMFLLEGRQRGVDLSQLVFLFVGVDGVGIKDYAKSKGYNFTKMFRLVIGNTLTGEQLLERAGRLIHVDEVFYEEMAGLVSPKYAGKA